MDCLSKDQIIIYLTPYCGDKDELEQHLKTCSKCSGLLQKYEEQLDSSLQHSQRECQLVKNNLEDYLFGKIKTIAGIDLSAHLEECEICRYIYEKSQKTLSFEEARSLDVSVPKQLLADIETSLAKTFKKNRKIFKKPGLVEEVREKVEEFLEYIELALRPVQPAFLGDISICSAVIKHAGGDVVLHIGEKGKTVKILTLEEVELGKEVSDDEGIVVFKDVPADNYKVYVEGYEVTKVRYKKEK